MHKLIKWTFDAWGGYLWPYLLQWSAVGFGAGIYTHSWWHYAEWPSFAVSLFATGMCAQKIRNLRRVEDRARLRRVS